MWPPSSGSSGTRLKMPTKKFSPASTSRNVGISPRPKSSPPIRLAPTTLIGVSGSRSAPVSAVHSFGTFSGNLLSEANVPSNIATVWSLVSPNAASGPRTVFGISGVMPSTPTSSRSFWVIRSAVMFGSLRTSCLIRWAIGRVAVLVVSWPSRRYVIEISLPPAARTFSVSASQPETRAPSRATIWSPARRPIEVATLAGSVPGTQSLACLVTGSNSHLAATHGAT